ncbi:MAG TPA: hypothetical protein VGX23_07280 [Actinocrinis sp.]|nr:hypothetical protein [Actinocrinis sp.]
MNLWEREIFPRHNALEHLSPVTRLAFAVEAVEWTLRTSPAQIRDQQAAPWIEAMMAEARAAVFLGAGRLSAPQELIDQFEEVDEDADEIGVSQLLTAIGTWCEPEPMSAETLEGSLFSCYVFSQQRETPEPESLEEEESNARCREVIEHQHRLISRAAS